MGGLYRLKRKEVDWMRQTTKTRFFAALMALVMVVSMLPMSVFAAETNGSYVQVTDLADITAGGEFVLVAESEGAYYAVETKTSGKPSAISVTVADGVVTGDSLPVWTVGSMDGGVSLSVDGAYLGYEKSTSFATAEEAYAWSVAAGENGFIFTSAAVNERGIFYQVSGNRFGAYSTKNTTGYITELLVFKYEVGTGETPSEPTEPSTAPTAPSEPSAPAVETVDIATALAGATDSEFTVKGVITLVDGQNLYLQDATGGICLRLNSAPSDVTLGDTVIGTGKRADYNGLPQLGSATYVKSEGITLKAKETTIDALTNADICTYVKISGVEVIEVYDNNGTYAKPNITVKDAAGNTIQLYKAVVDGVAVGDIVDIMAAVGVYKTTTLQLRNTLASEVTKVQGGTDPSEPTEPSEPSEPSEPTQPEGLVAELVTDVSELTEMTEIIIVAADADTALSTTQNLNNRGQAAITKDGNFVTYGEDTQIITIENGTVNGTYALFVGEGYLYAAASDKNYLRTEGEKSDNSAWTITIDESGIATIKANGENTRNWLRYNSGNKIFSCYGSGQKDVKIYKLVTPEVEPENPLSEGSRIVIYNPANMMALSTTYNGFYNNGTAVTMNNGVLSGYTDADIWTVGVNEDGTFTFSTADGKKLSMGASYTSTPLDDVNTAWEISAAATENCVYIKNAVRGNYLEWYASKNNWSSYGTIGSNEALFAQQIYLIVEDSGETPEPEQPEQPEQPEVPEVPTAQKMTELPGNGDTIIIYNSGNAMGSAASGKKLAGVPAEVADNKLPIADGMAQLLVTVDEDGNYIFTLEGKYLTSASTGNGLSFAEELTDCGKWTMETATDGTWYIKNVGANYNGNYNQALEYYSGFTTYGIKETAIYQMELFLVSKGEPAPEEPGRESGVVTDLPLEYTLDSLTDIMAIL